MQEMISKLQDRIQKAADAVLGRIQKEEAGVQMKFAYLRKPDRLDPNTYASKDDIAVWRDSLQQLKVRESGLDKLYAEADQDLGKCTDSAANQPVDRRSDQERAVEIFPLERHQKEERTHAGFH